MARGAMRAQSHVAKAQLTHPINKAVDAASSIPTVLWAHAFSIVVVV